MVKLNALTILNGLLRTQCIHGRMCCQNKQTYTINTPGFTFILDRDLRGLLSCNALLEALDGEKVGPSHLFISGVSTLDSIEFSIAVLLLVYNYYPKFRVVFTTYEQLEVFRILKTVPKEYVIKYQKYITAELPCIYFKQSDRNKVPPDFYKYFSSVYGYTGRIKHFLENRCHRESGTNLAFWNSWLQGIKRACHESEDEVLYDNYLEHADILSRKPEGELDRKVITYMLRVSECFNISHVRFFEASTSASFTTPRSKGGQRADVRNWLIKNYGIGTRETFVYNDTLYECWGPKIPDAKTLARDIVQQFLVKQGIVVPLRVKVHGILEPLKVRKITKGEAVPYWYCRSIQKDLHGGLQKYEQFSPTGRPIERFDIIRMIEREKDIETVCPLGFNGWVSGDYSAATDGVDIRVTMGILNMILQRSPLDENQKEIARAVLGPQQIHYPKVPGHKKIPSFVQQTGQLMGSILSFPILCMINIITYWKTLEEYTGHVFELQDLPVIVNGDDILFRANQEFYDMWKTNIGLVGFKMSVGKNYFHPDTFLINSQMFKIYGNPKTKFTLSRVPMYNIGLLTGKAKTTGRDSAKVKPLWSWYNEVIPGARDKWDAHKRFLFYHKEQILNLSKNGKLNLFIPRWLGGVGLPLIEGVREHVKFTYYQQLHARYVMEKIKEDCECGKKPTENVIRLLQEEQGGPTTQYETSYLSKAHTSISLGFHDKYRLIPLTQPLNYNESLELEEQHTLPLLANIPDEFNKPLMTVKYPKHLFLRQVVKGLQRLCSNYKPLPRSALLSGKEFKLVSVRPATLSEILGGPDQDQEFDPEIVPPRKFSDNLSHHLVIVTDEHHVRTLRKVQETRLYNGIKLIVHREV